VKRLETLGFVGRDVTPAPLRPTLSATVGVSGSAARIATRSYCAGLAMNLHPRLRGLAHRRERFAAPDCRRQAPPSSSGSAPVACTKRPKRRAARLTPANTEILTPMRKTRDDGRCRLTGYQTEGSLSSERSLEKDHGGREIMPRLELEVCHLTNDVKNP
jgi:hypothetical protein